MRGCFQVHQKNHIKDGAFPGGQTSIAPRAVEQHFPVAWHRQPNWVVSRSMKSIGPNATLIEGDLEAVIRGLKAHFVGENAAAGQTWREA